MPITIKTETSNAGLKAITIILVVIAIIVILLALWLYFIIPFLQRKSSTPTNAACTTAPPIPTNISGTASGNTVIITWSATTSTDSYNVYVSRVPVFDKGTAERTIPSTTNNLTVTNLIPVTYYFTVTSVNTCGESAFSTEIQVTITTWPTRIRICKQDDPTICLTNHEVTNGNPTVTLSCNNNNCTLDYPNQQHITKNPNDTFCLNTNFVSNPTIENAVLSEPCSNSSQQNWTIDLSTGRISSPSQNLCLGADDSAESFAYNTTCSVIANPQ